ncbi:MAG: serine hydrolase [Sediminibacterium sp.]|uniref:serine hydrolase domain-containing protein n=1 Tax=Sediminibacterium sp. TaxID=1917865 RepID=UPI00271D9E20|nr:serine hydrolase [Sediminibacterium sp.]MDO8997921.1 serine hydrolase [Sediminibacterium sp.]
MRILKWLFIVLIVVVGAFSAYAVLFDQTYLFKAAYYNFSAIDDYTIFENNKVAKAKEDKPWPLATAYNKNAYPDSLNNLLEDLSTVGVLMIKNDSILFEKYWEGYSDSSLSGSFSVAKSITSILIGAAIKEGKIKSVEQRVGDFIPAFAVGDKAEVKIKDLLTMSSGTNWNESYWNPLAVTAEAYYGADLMKTATDVKMVDQPGSLHKYKSGDTQLLGLILEKVTGKKLSEYAAEKLWQPLGASNDALWSTDGPNGNTKAFCCFNTNTRDFARIGKFMLDSGKINGVSVIDSAYWKQSITACNIKDAKGLACNYYGYQWWLDPQHPEIFYARGILGQYIIAIPSKKIIIVRLAHKASKERVETVPREVRALINWGLNS